MHSSRARFFIAFLAMIGTALFLFFGWKIYEMYSDSAPDPIAEAVKQYEEKDYAEAMADTYGGRTPQETLGMYITAVEQGNYVLASKYFIGANQEKEAKRLSGFLQKNIENYLGFLRSANPWESSIEDKEFIMEAKTNLDASLFIRFKKYPNGIWKIIEI